MTTALMEETKDVAAIKELLHSWWEWSAISQFLTFYLNAFAEDDKFDIELFERLVIERHPWVEELNIKMFRLGTRNR